MTRSDVELSTPYAKLMCLALGLLFLGRQELAEATTEVGGLSLPCGQEPAAHILTETLQRPPRPQPRGLRHAAKCCGIGAGPCVGLLGWRQSCFVHCRKPPDAPTSDVE